MSISTNIPCANLFTASLQNATGKLPYTLTNDYMFRATFQQNEYALKGLICSILGLKPEEVTSVKIKNPIELGKSIDSKDFILDLRILLNNDTHINIELQVLNLGNWPERSLGYLCRSFDTLNKGQDYIETKPVVQVCFLDFTLFSDKPEFFANYMFTNVKNYIIYSDKLRLSVVDLTQIDMATEEDKLRGLDYWARLFKATTWEEIKMLAQNNSFLAEAAETVYQLSAEESIRLQCEAREDYYKQQRYIQHKMDRLAQLEEREEEIAKHCAQMETTLAEQEKAFAEQEKALAEQEKALAEQEKALAEKDSALAAKDEEIARLKAALSMQKNAAPDLK